MECCICLEDVRHNKIILDCSHQFHSDCIYTWTINKKSCPVCRRLVIISVETLLKYYIQEYYNSVYPIVCTEEKILSKLVNLSIELTKISDYMKKISIYYVIMKIFEKNKLYFPVYMDMFIKKLNILHDKLPYIVNIGDKNSINLVNKIIKRLEKLQ